MKLSRLPGYLAFVAFMVAGAICYGIAHDLVTANVEVRYFSVYHPRVVASDSPWVLALVWGVRATWWVGFFFGGVIGWANVIGASSPLAWWRVRRAAALALGCLWLSAMGVLRFNLLSLTGDYRRLDAVAATHLWSYGAGAVVGLLLAAWVAFVRARTPDSSPAEG